MSLYRRPDSPHWHFDFTLDGQRFRGSTGEEGKRDAAKVEADHREAARRVRKQRGEWTMTRLCQTYFDERGQFARSHATILHQLAKLREHVGGNRKLSTVTNAAVLDYRARRKGEGLGDASINREIVILRAAMRYVSEMHSAPVPTLSWTKLMRVEAPGRTRFLSFDEFDALTLAAHPDLRPILIAAVTTGLRKSNLLLLDWDDVKLDQRIAQVRVKGNKRHSVRIVPQLLAALSTTPVDERKGRVFKCINFEKRWRAALAGASIADMRFHDLRHTFASWARQSGADIADVCEALAHSDISMTMRYAHIKPDATDTAFDKVSEAITSRSTSRQRISA